MSRFPKTSFNALAMGLMFLSSIALTASAQIAPQAPSSAKPPSRLTIRFEPKENIKPVAFEFVQGLIVFKGTVAGREVWGMIDNAAFPSLLDAEFAKSAGLRLSDSQSTLPTPTGNMPARYATDVAISIPGNFNAQSTFAVIDLSEASRRSGRKIDLVVGNEYFSSLAFFLDRVKRTFLFVPSGAIRSPEGLLPVTLIGNLPSIQITAKDKPLTVTLDLGSNGELSLSQAAWDTVAPPANKTTTVNSTFIDGRTIATRRSVLPFVNVGPISFKEVLVDVGPTLARDHDGRLGLGIFKHASSFALDVKAAKMWIKQESID